jgi:hypothetical protein
MARTGSVAAAEPTKRGLVTLAGGASLAFGEDFCAPVPTPGRFLAKLAAEPDDLPQLGNVVDGELNRRWK